jgi:H+/Cl- antiporter ClcA
MARSAIVLDSNLNTRGALLAISELNVSTMKRTPQKELTIVAIGLLIVAAAILGFVAYVAPAYGQIYSQPWQKSFMREADFEFYSSALRQFLFILLPLIAGIQIVAAWRLLKTAKRLESPAANESLHSTPR